MNAKKKIVVLSGGFSLEREVSLDTAENVCLSLNRLGFDYCKMDPVNFSTWIELIAEIKKFNPFLVFNALHGTDGEDGKLQALLSLAEIPFTGSDYQASVYCMNKNYTNIILNYFGISCPKYYYVDSACHSTVDLEKILQDFSLDLNYPVVLKPNNSGSSCGIFICKNYDELLKNYKKTIKVSNEFLLQEYIDGRELTVSILGEEVLPVVEIKVKNGWYDYSNKYTKGNTIYEVPANLSKEEEDKIKFFALEAFHRLGCNSYARVDFIFDGVSFYFLEVNTLPGMTELSLTPMAAKAAGIDFDNLISKIINFSFKENELY